MSLRMLSLIVPLIGLPKLIHFSIDFPREIIGQHFPDITQLIIGDIICIEFQQLILEVA